MKLNLRARLALSFAAAVAGALVAFSLAVVAVFAIAERAEAAKQGSPVSEEELSEDAGRVLLSMVLMAPFAIGGAGALGFWLARRAVAPLREATARVRAARASDLDLTLPVLGTGDEWDDLATTLNTLLKDARGSMERIRQFTADAAHELRTPLTAIIGEADVALRRERDQAELRGSLEVVHEEAERLTAILNALLTLARADAGTLLSGSSTVSLEEVVREAARLAMSETRSTEGGEVIVNIVGQVRGVIGDRMLLLQAVRNVIDNGLRHGGGQVAVELGEEQGAVFVRVSDRGPGIAAGLRPLLFQRFARGDEARPSGGLGLGLAIARAIMEAHGGSLGLLAQADGAVFEFRWPASKSGSGP